MYQMLGTKNVAKVIAKIAQGAASSEGVTWFHQLSDKRTIITSHTPVSFYLHVHVHDHR